MSEKKPEIDKVTDATWYVGLVLAILAMCYFLACTSVIARHNLGIAVLFGTCAVYSSLMLFGTYILYILLYRNNDLTMEKYRVLRVVEHVHVLLILVLYIISLLVVR